MATKTEIKNYIKERVYTNTNQEITGDGLQETLCNVVDDLELDPASGGVEKNYVDSQDKMTLDEAKKYTDAKVAGGGEALLTWRYSNVSSESAPLDPDKAPNLWHKDQADNDIWAALKESGGTWNIWRLKPENGTDGRGINSSVIEYVLADQGNNPPSSGWSQTMPDIVEGKYLWSRTTTTYTDDTTSVVYTVTYIGKDGNDGKNGTSVNIKGTLSSINDLPTTPTPSDGDGYIIGEDLWVYTGTSLENEKNHNGFTNVGKISVKGDTACLHIAWANTLAPDYENFTTQKPKGQRFRYMGTYVDYSEDPKTCLDSQNPEDYNWQEVIGEKGESVIVADIDNEIEAIALTYDGKTTSAGAFSPIVSMWYGTQKLTLDSLTTAVTGTDFSKNVVVVANKSTGIINVSYAEGINLTSFTVNITVKSTINGVQYVKLLTFKVKCVKAGAPGEDAVLYKIQPSVSSVKKFKDGSYSNTSVSCKKLKVVGKTISETTDGILYYKLDAQEKQVYTNAINTSLFTSKIRFELEVDGILWDAEDIFLIEDGTTPSIDNSKTKYFYALTMNHVIPADDAWSDNPVEGLPGQYLWVKTVYTWTDGTVTYTLSYSRCGFNGKSKPSIVSYKGVWTRDGLYTGNETDDSIIVDIVYYKESDNIDGKYYMSLATKGFINETTPQPGTESGKAYWGEFQAQYANIATDFLFSQQVVSNLIQAININATKIDADKIDTDDLIAKQVRTAESGERIVIQNNRLVSYDSDGKVAAEIDPSSEISIDGKLTPSLDISSDTNVFSRRTTSYQAGSTTQTYSLGQFSVTPRTSYRRELVASNISLYATVSNSASSASNVIISNKFDVKITATLLDDTYTIATGSLVTYETKYSIHQIPLTFSINDIVANNVSTVGCSVSVTITHTMTQLGSTTGYTNQVYVTLESGASFSIERNYGILIGKNAMYSGSVSNASHFIIGDVDGNPINIKTIGSGLRVTQDSVDVYTDNIRGYSKVVTPYIVDFTGFSGSSIDYRLVENMFNLYKMGVPVYIREYYNYLSGTTAERIYYMAKLEAITENSSSSSGFNDVVLFFAVNLHRMIDDQDSDTDHRLNIFINGKVRTTKSSYGYNGTITRYLHTV